MRKYFFLFLISGNIMASMTDTFIVTLLSFDQQTNIYRVHLQNQAGVYKADKFLFDCLEKSLKDAKKVSVTFNPMGLKIESCKVLE